MGRGLSAARLERLSGAVRRSVESGALAGAVTLTARGDEVHLEAIGVLDRESGAPRQRDSLFHIASMTKPILGAAAMILVEETRLRLDDPLDRWLPELANRRVLRSIDAPLDDTVPARRPLTLRDLLTLRMGLGAIM